MTKAEFISQALLRVSGGELTDSLSVRYGEAETYLAMAVNYAYLGDYRVEGKAEGEHAINNMMYTAFDGIAIQYSAVNQRYYFILPARIVILPKGRSFEISTETGQRLIPLTNGDDAMQQYYGQYDQQIKYKLEGNVKGWLYGIEKYPLLISSGKLRPMYIVNVMDVADTADLLLPADSEVKVVDMMVAFLSGQREAPKQYTEDGKDINIKQSA